MQATTRTLSSNEASSYSFFNEHKTKILRGVALLSISALVIGILIQVNVLHLDGKLSVPLIGCGGAVLGSDLIAALILYRCFQRKAVSIVLPTAEIHAFELENIPWHVAFHSSVRLGAGMSATIYDLGDNKVIRVDRNTTAETILAEARMLQRIPSHLSFPKFFGVGYTSSVWGPTWGLIYEKIEGMELAQYRFTHAFTKSSFEKRFKEVCKKLIPIVEALIFLEEIRHCHNDVILKNIMVRKEDKTWILIDHAKCKERDLERDGGATMEQFKDLFQEVLGMPGHFFSATGQFEWNAKTKKEKEILQKIPGDFVEAFISCNTWEGLKAYLRKHSE